MQIPIETRQVRDAYLLPYSNNTLLTYTYQLDRSLAWCVENLLDPLSVSRTDVEAYIKHLHEDLSQKISSVHTALVPVRGFYCFAFNEDLIARDPAAMARRPRLSRGVTDTIGLDRQQMRALLEAGLKRSARDCAIAYLLACMALRSSEVCSIRYTRAERRAARDAAKGSCRADPHRSLRYVLASDPSGPRADDGWMSVSAAASTLRCSESSVLRWTRTGALVGRFDGRAWLPKES